jgi:hypothetical protein
VPVRRIVHRPRSLQLVEVLRNGSSREAVMIGRNGLAAGGSSSGPSGTPSSDPSAYVASLGEENQGSGNYGTESAPEGGMTGAGAGINTGGY